MKRAAWIETLIAGRYAFLVLVALVSYFWLPALLFGKLIIHGDSAHHGLSLLTLHAKALAGHESLLWSSRIYGGHPIFAEGQGGFANLLNILVVSLFEPVRALGFLHWATLIVGGAGVFCLSRILCISRWSATFAAISVVFSGSWIFNQHDYPVMSTLAWMPWLLAAAEYWLLRPSLRRAAIMAVPAALLVFGGYPQVTHGAVVYIFVSLLAQPLQRDGRAFLRAHWLSLLLSGLLAILLATGLSAMQFIPLLELIGKSARGHGVALFDQELFFPAYLKGLFYFFLGDSYYACMYSLSSIAVLPFAGLGVLIRMPVRIVGQMFGVFLLFNLGMGLSSPLFRVAYEYHLIPGLHYFRVDYPYLAVAVVGISVVAAYVLDVLSERQKDVIWISYIYRRAVLGSVIILLATGFLYLCFRLYMPAYSAWSFLAPVGMAVAFVVLCKIGKRQWFPLLAVLILGIDVLALRVHVFNFYSPRIMEMPEVVRSIAADPNMQDYRVKDETFPKFMTFVEPGDPRVGPAYRQALQKLSPFPMAFQWNVSSIDGVTGLWLARRDLLDPIFMAESEGSVSTPAGLRLIDILGIRYLSRDTALNNPDLSLFAQDPGQSLFIYRNLFAKPRFQIYWNARVVDEAEQALAGLQAAQSETLFIEKIRGETPALPMECKGCAASKPAIEVVEAKAMRYRVNVEMPRDGWLFLADANYPGWEATVNGLKQPVYSAQVLGKAVRLQAGRNQVTIRYVPWSFYAGAALSAATLLLVIMILLRGSRVARAMSNT
jgi:hypothetical protein